jgi:hypothetical protein
MPQLVSSLVFGLSYVSKRHAVDELGWLTSQGWLVNRRDLLTPSEPIKSGACCTDRLPNPVPIDKARLITKPYWHQSYPSAVQT